MILRPATPRDSAAIAAIWNPVIRQTAATFTDAEKTVDGLAAQITTRHTEGKAFFVAEDSGAILGFATYSQFRGGPGYRHTMEHSVIVAPEARGRGVGRALMLALEDHARRAGVHSLWAAVSAENPDGVAFHARLGFRTVATLPQVGRKFGRWMDLVLMQKIL